MRAWSRLLGIGTGGQSGGWKAEELEFCCDCTFLIVYVLTLALLCPSISNELQLLTKLVNAVSGRQDATDYSLEKAI
jgi:hypothetical protein